MPYSSNAVRKSPPKPWVTIDPVVSGDDPVRIHFSNPTGHAVGFTVEGVQPKSLSIDLDGATSWESDFFADPKAFRINVRLKDSAPEEGGDDKLLATVDLGSDVNRIMNNALPEPLRLATES